MPAPTKNNRPPNVALICASLFSILALCLCAQLELPLWLQPSVVGVVWATLFFLGTRLNMTAQPIQLLCACLASVPLTQAFQLVTDLSLAECVLASCALLGAGWLTWRPNSQASRRGHWSIWEMMLATTIVAIALSCFPNITSSMLLLLAVVLTLVGGIVFSAFAHRIVLNDDWNLAHLGICAGIASIWALIAFLFRPTGTTWTSALTWLMTGPLLVVSSQFTWAAVLFLLERYGQAGPVRKRQAVIGGH